MTRVLAILRGHAGTAVSFQLLESDFEYWFEDDAFVAYVDTGGPRHAGTEATRRDRARRIAAAAAVAAY